MKTGEISKMPVPMQRAYLTLPDRLYQIRKERNLTQLDVELETGIIKESISLYENGLRYPVFYNLVRLAAFYGVSVGWLIGETE